MPEALSFPRRRESSHYLRQQGQKPLSRRRGFARFAKFTNEVQHPAKVLRLWEELIDSSRWKSDVRLPVFMEKVRRSGKLLQLWIARHRRSRGS